MNLMNKLNSEDGYQVIADEAYQDQILPHVSRTFALTIPQLPGVLRAAVTNAYLLCRIADTIEDEPALSAHETLFYMQRFKSLVDGGGDPGRLAAELTPRLTDETLPTERELVANMARVLRVTASFDAAQRAAIQRCVGLMCYGMPRFAETASLRGLARSSDLDEYCYYVAGVVGEMLTELFCTHSAAIARHRATLRELAPSFAQGLQMTNILKDVWEDRARGACWLPQDVFSRFGLDLAGIAPHDPRVAAALRELIGVAHAHLRNALAYTLLIPRSEPGIRRFLLWAVGLAILTLRKITANPGYVSGADVKVTRRAVALTRLATGISLRSNRMLRALFDAAARGVPLAMLPPPRRSAWTQGAIECAPDPLPLERAPAQSSAR
jgi:farnesyl-diphosphate farnesyltransferase